MPAQVPKTQELVRFAASFRRLRSEKPSASGGVASPPGSPPGALPLDPAGGSAPDPCYIGSRSALAMAWPPPMKISAYAFVYRNVAKLQRVNKRCYKVAQKQVNNFTTENSISHAIAYTGKFKI